MRKFIEELRSLVEDKDDQGDNLDEAKSEKDVARGMKKKGYEYILLVPNQDALYAKTMSLVTDLLKTDLKKYKNIPIKKIDAFLKEEEDGDDLDEEWDVNEKKVDKEQAILNLNQVIALAKGAQKMLKQGAYMRSIRYIESAYSELNSTVYSFVDADPASVNQIHTPMREMTRVLGAMAKNFK